MDFNIKQPSALEVYHAAKAARGASLATQLSASKPPEESTDTGIDDFDFGHEDRPMKINIKQPSALEVYQAAKSAREEHPPENCENNDEESKTDKDKEACIKYTSGDDSEFSTSEEEIPSLAREEMSDEDEIREHDKKTAHYTAHGSHASEHISTVIFLAMTYSQREECSTRVLRDTRRIKYMMDKYYNKTNEFVSVSMAPGFENEKTANYLWANFADARFYKKLENHILSYSNKLSTNISCVILDYVNMPGIYAAENYLGKQMHLLDFFKQLTMNSKKRELSMSKNGCIYIPLTPSFYERIEYSRKLKTTDAPYVMSFLERQHINRHPLVASDMEIEDEISWLDKKIEDSTSVLGKQKKSKNSSHNEEVFLLVKRR